MKTKETAVNSKSLLVESGRVQIVSIKCKKSKKQWLRGNNKWKAEQGTEPLLC